MPPDDNEEAVVPGPAEASQENTDEARDLLRAIHSSIGRFLEGETQRRETDAAPPARIETGITGIDSMIRGGLPLGRLTELYGDERASGVGATIAQAMQPGHGRRQRHLRICGVGATIAQAMQQQFSEVGRDEPPFLGWHISRHTVPDAEPTLRSVHLHGSAVDFEGERGPFRPPTAPANPGPVAFGTGIHDLPVWEEPEGLPVGEGRDPEGSYMAAVSEEPPEGLEPYILWLHQLDLHTNWIRVSHNNWVVRHALGRVYITSPTGPFYRLYRVGNRNQCPSTVQEDIARWLLDAAGPHMFHELLEGYLAENSFLVGEEGEWSFHWNDQSDELAVRHDNTGLFFYYSADDDSMPPVPFEVLDAAMQLHNRLQPREVADASGNIYTLRLSFDPPDVLCGPPPDDPMDAVLTEYVVRFRDSLDNLYNAPLVDFDPVTDVGIDAKPVEGQSRWTLVDEDHASGE